MGAPDFLVVRDVVARNPVARAISRQRITAATRDFSIQVHLLDDGEDVRVDLSAAARVLAVACRVAALRADSTQRPEARDTPALRVMTGGMSAIAQCSERGWRWRRLDAVAVDQALYEAMSLVRGASTRELRDAWAYVEAMR